jgi:hypothetical protein
MRGTGNSTVTITCNENNDLNDRIGVLIFRSVGGNWNYSTTVTVSQTRSVYKAIPDKDSIVFSWTENQAIIEVDANNDVWTVSAMEDLSAWCTVNKHDGVIEINCSLNNSDGPRKGRLVIETPDGSQVVWIVQSAIEMDLGTDDPVPDALNFSASAGTAQIYVKTDSRIQWTATATADWITISPSEGTGNGTINVSVTGNEEGPVRTGTIRVQAYDYVREINVFQNGKYMNVTSPVLSFSSNSGEITLSLSSNDGWTASADCDWLVLSETQGNDDCNILLSVKDNNSSLNRSGTITITPSIAIPVVLHVEQAGRYLELSDSTVVFGWDGVGSKVFIVTTDGEYDVSSDCSWLTYKKNGGLLCLAVSDMEKAGNYRDTVRVYLTGLNEGTLEKTIIVTLHGQSHSYVDLGLSVKWATCNVGASKPEEFGDFYAWGEMEPYYEPGYAQSDNPVWKKGKSYGYISNSYSFYSDYVNLRVTKYSCNDAFGINDGKYYLDPEDDVATVKWGYNWRMPSDDECWELIMDCTSEWIVRNGVKGMQITSNKKGYEDRSIFVPANGYRNSTMYESKGEYGCFWLNTIDKENCSSAYNFTFHQNGCWEGSEPRYMGHAIRPVCPLNDTELLKIGMDYTDLTMNVNDQKKFEVYAFRSNDNNFRLNQKDVILTSSDSKVAFINDGTVYAMNPGTCVITAVYGIYYINCTVTVVNP